MTETNVIAVLDKIGFFQYNGQGHRGVAKFGIALGSGPRGLGFESRHSDQNCGNSICYSHNFYRVGIRKDDTSPQTGVKSVRWTLFRQYEVTPNLQNVDLPVILKLPHKKYTGITTYKEESL